MIGGTRFMGYQLTWRLIAAGHEVTLLNRGTHPDPFGARVARLRADRTRPEFAAVLAGRSFDAAVDFAAFQRADAEGVVAVLDGRVGHYVMISTGQVYLVKAHLPPDAAAFGGAGLPMAGGQRPSREEDYDGPLMDAPPVGHRDRGDWEYGVGKRACEDALAASPGFPSTRLRIPIVNGERDNTRRLEGYVWRILDGSPVLVPDGGSARVRQVYSGAVVSAILRVLGDRATFGQAYNLCQQETPTLAELVALLAELLGVPAGVAGAPARVVDVPASDLESAGLDPVAASPFSTRWKSFLDPGRAVRELGFVHPPLRAYLERVVSSLLAGWREDPPVGYAQRSRELDFARLRPAR